MESKRLSSEVSKFACLKTDIVLLFFDTLRHPDRHASEFELTDSFIISGIRMFTKGKHATAERDMIDASVSVQEKASQIMRQFKPIARALQPHVAGEFSPMFIKLCDENLNYFSEEEL